MALAVCSLSPVPQARKCYGPWQVLVRKRVDFDSFSPELDSIKMMPRRHNSLILHEILAKISINFGIMQLVLGEILIGTVFVQ